MSVAAAPAATEQPSAPYLPGDLMIWLVILLELATFAIFFVVFAFVRALNVEAFNAAQALLDVDAGARNTLLLLTASWCVVRAVHALREGASQRARGWLLGALLTGTGFLLQKGWEYADKAREGHMLGGDSLFFDLYYILTGFHALHVVVGLLALAIMAWRVGRPAASTQHSLETAAAFWHLVDLLWLVLFPLVYVMR